MRRYIKTLVTTALTFTTLAFASVPAWSASTELYRITDREPTFQRETASIAGVIDEVELALDTRALDLNPRVLEMELPDGRRLTVSRDRFAVELEYLTWVGEAAVTDGAASGYVHLVDHGDQVSGILNIGSDRYQIVATALGGHRLVGVKSLKDKACMLEDSDSQHANTPYFDPEDWESRLSDLETSETFGQSTGGNSPMDEIGDGSQRLDPTEKATTVIDVMAVYPNAFSGSEETSLHNFIQHSVSLANDIFVRSNINARYRLVKMTKLSGAQPPATGLRDGWGWINDTELSGIDDLRHEYSADMVALFIPLSYDADSYCGIANIPVSDGGISPVLNLTIPGAFGDRALQRSATSLWPQRLHVRP